MGIVGETQGNLYSRFLEGDQIHSSKKRDLRDCVVIEDSP